jgi:hypothetical protein
MTDKNAFKSASLLALRGGTGLLRVLWGALQLINPDAGPGLATRRRLRFHPSHPATS